MYKPFSGEAYASCQKCNRPMHLDRGDEYTDTHWRCLPCEDRAIERANEAAEWRHYHQ